VRRLRDLDRQAQQPKIAAAMLKSLSMIKKQETRQVKSDCFSLEWNWSAYL